MKFNKAQRGKRSLKMGIYGVSGSGKTYTALSIATGILEAVGGTGILFGDTEADSSTLYADLFDFYQTSINVPKEGEINKPAQQYLDLIHNAEQEGFKVLIIDSFSHFWDEMLQYVDLIANNYFKGNSYFAWQKATPVMQRVTQAITTSPMHIILCLRAKQEYVVEMNNGKASPKKVGTGIKYRDGWEYELDIVASIDKATLHIEKTRFNELTDSVIAKPDKNFGTTLYELSIKNTVKVDDTINVTPELEQLEFKQPTVLLTQSLEREKAIKRWKQLAEVDEKIAKDASDAFLVEHKISNSKNMTTEQLVALCKIIEKAQNFKNQVA